jgi:hypothetical protein
MVGILNIIAPAHSFLKKIFGAYKKYSAQSAPTAGAEPNFISVAAPIKEKIFFLFLR